VTNDEKNGPPVFYKCPGCPCLFLTPHDLKKHLDTFGTLHEDKWRKFHEKLDSGAPVEDAKPEWRRGTYGDEICLAESDPKLTKIVAEHCGEWTQCGGYDYKLSTNGKWLLRRPS